MVELVQFREAVQFFQIIFQRICTNPNHAETSHFLDKDCILLVKRRSKWQNSPTYARLFILPPSGFTKTDSAETTKNRGLGVVSNNKLQNTALK
jgi:hypothetical protein